MTLTTRLDAWGAGWRGPLLAAFLALVAGLPGLTALPPLDRDEARFAEASAQMLESGDFVAPHFQDAPRFKKPVGIYWLQALAVTTTSSLEDRAIWAYRLPSLLGAMLAAAACAWGAAAFLRPGQALLAGGLLATGFLLSTEADIAATDGLLCGAVTLAMAALARMYLTAGASPVQTESSERGQFALESEVRSLIQRPRLSRANASGSGDGRTPARAVKALFWVAFAVAVLVKGPVGPMVIGLTLISLCVWDRKIGWLRDLGWGWGLILTALVVGPWAMAITVATDGAFWGAAVGGDLAPKLVGDQEGHGAPPGFYLALAPLLLFPAAILLPAGLTVGWRARAEPAVRFAVCWLVPTWLVFELIPTKLVHYTLPLYGALAWLMARALSAPIARTPRAIGAGLNLAAGVAFAGAIPAALQALKYSSDAATAWAVLAGGLFLLAGAGGAVLFWRERTLPALMVAGAGAVAAHAVLIGALAPSLQPLWLSSRAARALVLAGLSPRQGVVPGPVTVAGFEEPSLVFLLGADTVLGNADDAADAVVDGRPAIVEARQEAAFQAALKARLRTSTPAGAVAGLDYSNNQRDVLTLYRPASRPGVR